MLFFIYDSMFIDYIFKMYIYCFFINFLCPLCLIKLFSVVLACNHIIYFSFVILSLPFQKKIDSECVCFINLSRESLGGIDLKKLFHQVQCIFRHIWKPLSPYSVNSIEWTQVWKLHVFARMSRFGHHSPFFSPSL